MSTFKSLSTANLPDPAIDPAKGENPTDYFNTITWTGNTATSRAFTGVGFQPNWLWSKSRSATRSHALFDSVRGVTKYLAADDTAAELSSPSSGFLSSFDADGFTATQGSSNFANLNNNSETYVGWLWKAGGSGVSNTDGSITSTVSANTESGFSIVTYTGNGTNGATVGHGLGVTPDMLIIKARSATTGWSVNHVGTGMTSGYLQLQSTAAFASASNNVTGISSSTFTLGVDSWVNASGQPFICYAFNSVEGFSRFSSYVGNGSADGPFVYTGFRPAFLLLKNINSSTRDWNMLDSTINDFNVADNLFYPNGSNAELTSTHSDFLSNGFKIRNTGVQSNGSGNTMIYMCFAEQPFRFSNAR